MKKSDWKRLDKHIETFSKQDKGYKCEICGRSKAEGYQIHHHHWIARTTTSLRWVNQNIFCVCFRCHKRFHDDPYWSLKTAEDMRGHKWVKLINEIKVKINKKSYEQNLELVDKSLEEVLKSYGA